MKGLDIDPTDGLQVSHLRDADDDDGEDDRGDHHSDQLDEAVPERSHRSAGVRRDVPEHDADRDRDDDLNLQDRIEWLAATVTRHVSSSVFLGLNMEGTHGTAIPERVPAQIQTVRGRPDSVAHSDGPSRDRMP